MPEFGIIGGSGLYDMPGMQVTDTVRMTTPFGEPSAGYTTGTISGHDVAFLPRHGDGHLIQPHKINYRANMWGFRELGVRKVLSVGASGGIGVLMKPGVVTVPDQIIDRTSGRPATFYDEDRVVHIDFTEPFCPDLRSYLVEAAGRSGIGVVPAGVYICVNGPRLETAAEIRAFRTWGADMVGMTAMPEAALARELELCYAIISVITNYAAGATEERLTAAEVVDMMHRSEAKIKSLLENFFLLRFDRASCGCGRALKDAAM